MMAFAARIACFVLGHPDSLVCWGPWASDREVGRYRMLTERCSRCDAVLALASVLEKPWAR